jgi:hypothetical protein
MKKPRTYEKVLDSGSTLERVSATEVRDALGATDRQPRVKIVNRQHPHHGEYGRFTSEVIQMRFGLGNKMALVKLESCKHGTDRCYVSPGDIREVNDDDQYV